MLFRFLVCCWTIGSLEKVWVSILCNKPLGKVLNLTYPSNCLLSFNQAAQCSKRTAYFSQGFGQLLFGWVRSHKLFNYVSMFSQSVFLWLTPDVNIIILKILTKLCVGTETLSTPVHSLLESFTRGLTLEPKKKNIKTVYSMPPKCFTGVMSTWSRIKKIYDYETVLFAVGLGFTASHQPRES